MILTVVGCSGSVPGPEAACSCHLREHDGFRLLLDAGTGALGPLQRFADPCAIDAVVISHRHRDHCSDLVPLAYLRDRRDATARLPVIAPAGTGAHVAAPPGYGPRPSDHPRGRPAVLRPDPGMPNRVSV